MSNIEEDIMSEEAFNELIDNFEIVGTLTEYSRKAIKQNVKNLQKRIKELEEENNKKQKYINMASEVIENSILKQKVKDKKKEIKKTGQYLYTNENVCNILEELVEEK